MFSSRENLSLDLQILKKVDTAVNTLWNVNCGDTAYKVKLWFSTIKKHDKDINSLLIFVTLSMTSNLLSTWMGSGRTCVLCPARNSKGHVPSKAWSKFTKCWKQIFSTLYVFQITIYCAACNITSLLTWHWTNSTGGGKIWICILMEMHIYLLALRVMIVQDCQVNERLSCLGQRCINLSIQTLILYVKGFISLHNPKLN